MRLQFTPEDEAFRQDVRDFLSTHLPAGVAEAEASRSHLNRAECAEWHRIVYEQGWAAPGWPVAYGGTGWSATQRYIFEVEYGLANAPELSVIGLNLVGPLLCRFASNEQKERLLGPILRGEIYFCQGFSEPQAGSDLASVRTRAVRVGDSYAISGQKTWTSHASDADYMICLARTNPDVKPQLGLSLFVVPMDSPGITVRSIATIDGRSSVNEVFIDSVVVSARDCVGEPDQAWTYTKALLDHERTHNAYIGILKRYLGRIRRLVERPGHSDRTADRLRDRFFELEIDVGALEWSVLRVIAASHAGQASASALKVKGSELLMRAADLELDLVGPAALAAFSEAPPHNAAAGRMSQSMYWRASSIFGGANEIQRSIIWNSLYR